MIVKYPKIIIQQLIFIILSSSLEVFSSYKV